MENITPRQKLRRPYIAVLMGLPFMTSAQLSKKKEEDWCRDHIPDWCKGRQIIDTNVLLTKTDISDSFQFL
jgi:hypothetical protein